MRGCAPEPQASPRGDRPAPEPGRAAATPARVCDTLGHAGTVTNSPEGALLRTRPRRLASGAGLCGAEPARVGRPAHVGRPCVGAESAVSTDTAGRPVHPRGRGKPGHRHQTPPRTQSGRCRERAAHSLQQLSSGAMAGAPSEGARGAGLQAAPASGAEGRGAEPTRPVPGPQPRPRRTGRAGWMVWSAGYRCCSRHRHASFSRGARPTNQETPRPKRAHHPQLPGGGARQATGPGAVPDCPVWGAGGTGAGGGATVRAPRGPEGGWVSQPSRLCLQLGADPVSKASPPRAWSRRIDDHAVPTLERDVGQGGVHAPAGKRGPVGAAGAAERGPCHRALGAAKGQAAKAWTGRRPAAR